MESDVKVNVFVGFTFGFRVFAGEEAVGVFLGVFSASRSRGESLLVS